MTREYAARKLLRLGQLTLSQFVEITGWPRQECRELLADLRRRRLVGFVGSYQKGCYRVGREHG